MSFRRDPQAEQILPFMADLGDAIEKLDASIEASKVDHIDSYLRDFMKLPRTAPVLSECDECGEIAADCLCEDRDDPNYDPTPWCSGCGAMRASQCDCGPIARNE